MSLSPRVSLARNAGCVACVRPRAPIYRYALRINHSSPTIPLLLFSTGGHTMSAVPSTSTSHSNFASIFNAALESYKRKTNSKEDLASHPLLPRLQYCDSPDAIISIFREQIAFDRTGDGFTKATKWVIPTVNVLHAFSGMLGQAAGLVNVWIYPYRELLL